MSSVAPSQLQPGAIWWRSVANIGRPDQRSMHVVASFTSSTVPSSFRYHHLRLISLPRSIPNSPSCCIFSLALLGHAALPRYVTCFIRRYSEYPKIPRHAHWVNTPHLPLLRSKMPLHCPLPIAHCAPLIFHAVMSMQSQDDAVIPKPQRFAHQLLQYVR